jgi:hypothetical protein
MIDTDNVPNTGTFIPGEDAPADDTRVIAPSSDSDGDDDGGDNEVTDRARLQGWVPRDEFRGPADKWRPADEFLKRGEEIVPILKERTKTLESKLAEADAKLARQESEAKERFARLERMSDLALKRQREDIYASYEAAKRSAVEVGDVDRYEQLNRDQRTAIHQHDQRFVEAVQPVQQPQPQGQRPLTPAEQMQIEHHEKTVASWTVRNPWFTADQEMEQVARTYSNKLKDKTPGITLEDNLKATETYIRQRYPDKFPGSSNASGPSVEGGSRLSSSGTRKRGAMDLPSDAKKQGEKFIQQGLFKNMDEYARDYWSPENA